MFESSLLSTQAGGASRRTRWTILLSVALQAAALAAVVFVPLLCPATLPSLATAPKVLPIALFQRPKARPLPVKPLEVKTEQANVPHAPAAATQSVTTARGGHLSPTPGPASSDEPLLPFGAMASMGTPGTGLGLGSTPGPGVVAVASAPKSSAPLRISQGVSAGLLLEPIRPIYPRIAIAARLSGTVIVTATIDKQGRIVNLQVVSGPPMLRNAAVDAVAAARYRPYLLNGESTEVVTTISVNFRMDS